MNKIELISTLPHLRIVIKSVEIHSHVINYLDITQSQKSEFNLDIDELLSYCRGKEDEHDKIGDGHFLLESTKDHLEIVHRSMIAYRHNAGSKHIPAGNMIVIYDDLTEIINYIDMRLNEDSLDVDTLKRIYDDIEDVKKLERAGNVVKFPAQD